MGSIFFMTLLFAFYPKIYRRSSNISWKVNIDMALPAILLGQVIGRWGNFANHQVFGDIVSGNSLNWLPSFVKNNMYIKTTDGFIGYRNPLFLYESFANAISFVLILTIIKYNKKFQPGTQGAAFLVLYGIIRSTMELLRDPLFQMNWGSFHTSFCAAIIFIIFGILLFMECQNKNVSKAWGIIKNRRKM